MVLRRLGGLDIPQSLRALETQGFTCVCKVAGKEVCLSDVKPV
jgi:hypothetical protein